MERYVAFAVLVRLKVLVEFNTVGRNDGVALLTHFQVGVARKLEPVVWIVRPLLCGDIHHGLVVLQFYLRHVKAQVKEPVAITVSKLRGGLFPHNRFLFCLPHYCDKGEQDGDDGFLFILYFCAFSISFLIVSGPGKPMLL